MLHRLARKRALGIVVVSVFGAIVYATACSNNGEGERCDFLNGNDDCINGLQCVKSDQLVNSSADRCCPVDRSTATSVACKPGTATVGNTPPDAGEGGTDATTTDAANDAADASDASDSSSDAANDAPDGD